MTTYNTPTQKPTGKVSSLSCAREKGTLKFTAKWGIPSALTSTKDADGRKRTTELHIDFVLDNFRPGKAADPYDTVVHRDTKNYKATQSTLNLNNFSITTGSGRSKKTTVFNRTSFFPSTVRYLRSVTCKVWCANQKGEASSPASSTYRLSKPGKPTISSLTQTEEEGHIQFTITAFDGPWDRERYDTRYEVSRYDSRTDSKKVIIDEGSFTGAKKEWTSQIDVQDRQHLTYDQYVVIYVHAMSRGLAGISDGLPVGQEDVSRAWTTEKLIVVGYPNEPVIKGILPTTTEPTDKVTFLVNLRHVWDQHPVTGCRLQKLVSSDAETATEAAAKLDEWQDTESVDDQHCTALALSVSDLLPAAGKHTWVRIKSWNQFESMFARYSKPIEVKALYRDMPAADDRLSIVSIYAGDDGESIVALIGWNNSGTPDTGTELSWSEDRNAWRSTKGPETYELTWDDGPLYVGSEECPVVRGKVTYSGVAYGVDGGTVTVEGIDYDVIDGTVTIYEDPNPVVYPVVEGAITVNGVRYEVEGGTVTIGGETYEVHNGVVHVGGESYSGSAEVHVAGLENGIDYYVKARRYLVDEETDEVTYGDYAGPYVSTPAIAPSSVALNAPPYVTSGSDLSLSWAYEGGATQTAWSVVTGTVTTTTDVDGSGETRTHQWISDEGQVVVASGSDASGATIISAERFAGLVGDGASLPMAVLVSTGGQPVASEAVVVRVADAPTLSMTTPEVVTEQPVTLSFECSSQARLAVVARASAGGVHGSGPMGDVTQAGGDVVWQTAVTPEWVPGNGSYAATVITPTLPSTLNLIDNGSYDVTASATDTETGLASEAVTSTFAVAWAHQAPTPAEPTLTPYDTTDEAGTRMRGCSIQLTEPDGAAESDVYDLYRLTPDGPYLVAENVSLDGYADDQYAPYGGTEKGYRVATRTVDGDVDWLDFGYELAGKDLRIDFGGEYVELPYNLTDSDSYEKGFEARTKLSGDVDGFWDASVQRNASLSTALIRVMEQDKAAAVRRLGRHTGPCFVRTPDGCAYMANVQVNEVSMSHAEAALSVSFDATEVTLTDEYRADVPIPDSPESGGNG